MKRRGLFLTAHSLAPGKVQVHSLLEAELEDIRGCLSRLEQKLKANVIDFVEGSGEENRAA